MRVECVYINAILGNRPNKLPVSVSAWQITERRNIEATQKKQTNAKAALPEQNLFKGRDTHLSLFPLQKVANDVRFN